ncbi:unnamed protein product [Penicillium roqueforti FM164]|uniref:Uncharacterized protein n=1 Tax=Penicillium roqueforti (strain FM164) TaxID=1365484 RepID=W6QQF5_PENRF|nr:unnamed protein product [Penicillium roqueforti FM164]
MHSFFPQSSNNPTQNSPRYPEDGNLLFKGLSRRAVASLAAFLTLHISPKTFDHEFRPGFYTNYSFKHAMEYAGSDGVILIFKTSGLWLR